MPIYIEKGHSYLIVPFVQLCVNWANDLQKVGTWWFGLEENLLPKLLRDDICAVGNG